MAPAVPSQVIRVTMFKLLSSEQVGIAVSGYQELAKSHSRNGKPYILSLEAGPTYDDARNQGFTFVSKTVFKNREDHDFYDKDCPAHKKFKQMMSDKGINTLQQGLMTVFYTPAVTNYIQTEEAQSAPVLKE